jgi:hypothetical protein
MHLNYTDKYGTALLRLSYKSSGRVRKLTLANVSHWKEEALDELASALDTLRQCRRQGRDLEARACEIVLRILAENELRCEPWQYPALLRALHYGERLPQEAVNWNSLRLS